MKEKYGIKLADFIREMINTIILKKPVKSRVSDTENVSTTPFTTTNFRRNLLKFGSLRRIAEVHRRICHAMHDVHLAARMAEAFLNYIKLKRYRIFFAKLFIVNPLFHGFNIHFQCRGNLFNC